MSRSHTNCARTFAGAICIGSLCVASAAWAQSTSQPARPQATTTDAAAPESALGDIVVTAQKREQNIQNVGVSISAFSGKDLPSEGIKVATDLAKFIPGVSPSGSFAGQNLSFSIRGVTQQDFFVQAESPVAVYVDEGYFANNNAASIGLFDVKRVEVLKGPQGTLFGRNATGGLVSITTNKPTANPEGYVSFSYGSYNTARLEAAVSGPLTDKLRFRVAGLLDSNDGWVKNISPTGGDLGGQRTLAIRGHLEYDASSTATFLLTGYGSWINQSWAPYFSFPSAPVFNSAGVNVDNVLTNGLTGLGTPKSDIANLTVNANDAQSRGGFNDVSGATFKADFDIGPKLTFITDYKDTAYRLQIDDDASSVSFFNTDTNAFSRNASQEVRLYGTAPQLRWYAGLYYLWISSGLRPDRESLPSFGVYYDSSNHLSTHSYSAFAQAEYDLAPMLTAIGGIRVTKEKKQYFYKSDLFLLDGTSLGPARGSYTGSSDDTLVSVKAQLEYRPSHDVLAYAGFNRGQKAGNFNAPFAGGTSFPDSQIPYKPETLNAYEAGVKTTILSGSTLLNGAVYYYDYHDYQAFQFIGISSQVTNNPARTYGAELSIVTTPVTGLRLGANGSYIDNHVYDVALGDQVLTRVSTFTPRWKLSGNVNYTFALASGMLTTEMDATYTGAHYFSLTNTSASRVDPYTLMNARVTWQSGDKHYEVAFFVNNLTNNRYKTVGFDLTNFVGSDFTQIGIGKPRWFGGTLTARY